MGTVEQLFMGLTEDATERLEALLRSEVCPQHIGTTLTANHCEMCLLDEMADLEHKAQEQEREGGMNLDTEERLSEVEEALDSIHHTQPQKPVWVRRAEASLLPPKVIQ